MMYPMFTMNRNDEKKFEARIPQSLWDAYDQWAEGRGKIGNRQLLIALLRLFLGSPEWMQMMALYAKDDRLNIEAGIRQSRLEFLLNEDERRIEAERENPLAAVAAVVNYLPDDIFERLPKPTIKKLMAIREIVQDLHSVTPQDTSGETNCPPSLSARDAVADAEVRMREAASKKAATAKSRREAKTGS